jgi:hypothetical protein
VGLSGLPDLESKSAADITDAWLKVADLMAANDKSPSSDATPRNSGTSVANGSSTNVAAVISMVKPEVTAEVQKALMAAAATNQSGHDGQIESWLALAASNAVSSAGEAELEALAEATAELPDRTPIQEAVAPAPLPPPEVSLSIASQIEALLPGGNGSQKEASEKSAEPEAEAKASAARAAETATSVAFVAQAAVAAAAAANCIRPAIAIQASQRPQDLSLSLNSLALAPPDVAAGELTGIEMLKAMADTRGKEDLAGDSRPMAGYAMVSMMHRAAENAKRNMRSRMAEELLSKPPTASAGKASKQSEPPLLDPEELVQNGEEAGLMFLGSIPKGTGEGLILAECTKYGQVQSIYYDPTRVDMIEGAWALVTFVAQESAAAAVKRMSKRSGLFGGTESVEVRLGTLADTKKVEQHRASSSVQAEATDERKPLAESVPVVTNSLTTDEPQAAEQERHREEKEKKRDRRKDRSDDDDRDRRRKDKKKDKDRRDRRRKER